MTHHTPAAWLLAVVVYVSVQDGRCSTEIQKRIAMAKEALSINKVKYSEENSH